jgi:3D (Asp-Asp-Asp) domain-containing protein
MKNNLIIAIFIMIIVIIPKSYTQTTPSVIKPKSITFNINPPTDSNSIKIDTKRFKKMVTLTTYTISKAQTDNTPLITASGFKLDSINPYKHRIISISRDLKKIIGFGDTVILENAGKYNGVWRVEDLMNSRFVNKIDILINPNDVHTKMYEVTMTSVKLK